MVILIACRWFCIEHIIVFFFFADTKVVAEVNAKPSCVWLAETTGIYWALADSEIIFIAGKHITEAEGDCQFLFHKFSVDAGIQCTKSTQLIKLLLAFKSHKSV